MKLKKCIVGRQEYFLRVTGMIVKSVSNTAEVFPWRINIDISEGITETKLKSAQSYALGGSNAKLWNN